MQIDSFIWFITVLLCQVTECLTKNSKMEIYSRIPALFVSLQHILYQDKVHTSKRVHEYKGVLAFSCKRQNLIMRGVFNTASSHVQILCYKTTVKEANLGALFGAG